MSHLRFPGGLVLAVPFSIIEPLWDQLAAILPPHVDTHPLGCHRPRISDRVIFDKLIQALVLGAAYEKIVDLDLSNTTVDGCLVKAPCGGEAARKSPVDRGKLGTNDPS